MELLKDHTLSRHSDPDEDEIEDAIGRSKRKFPFVPVNVVDLECKMCSDSIIGFRDLENHLSVKHSVEIPESKDPVVVPFKIANGECVCALCGKSYTGFKGLSNHMNEHYPNYKCEICGTCFLAPHRLKSHSLGHRRSDKNTKSTPEGSSRAPYKVALVKRKIVKRVTPRKAISIVKSKTGEVKRAEVKKKKLLKEETDTPVKSLAEKAVKVNSAAVLIKNSNVLPFKTGSGFTCFYCKTYFGEIEQLQKHNDEKHDNPDEATIRRILWRLKSNQIGKVNIVDIKCRLCDDSLKDLEELKSHLSENHGKKLHACDDVILPFKIAKGVFECALCGEKHPGCKALSQHMNKHYRNHICELCGVGFLSASRLKGHSLTHLSHTFPCEVCGRAFKTNGAMVQHRKYVHNRQQNNRCPHCSETFHDYYARQKHISSVHNIELRQHKCEICPSAFLVKSHLGKHIRDVHKKERSHECTECDKKFFYVSKLEEHMLSKHGGVSFACGLCPKSYSVKKTLAEHVRKAHPNCRYMCEHCGKNFVLKCSLEKHILGKHRHLMSAPASCAVVCSND